MSGEHQRLPLRLDPTSTPEEDHPSLPALNDITSPHWMFSIRFVRHLTLIPHIVFIIAFLFFQSVVAFSYDILIQD